MKTIRASLKLLILALFLPPIAIGARYIVLFPQSGSGVGSLEPKQLQQSLAAKNAESMTLLEEWSARNLTGRNFSARGVWLIEGAIAELTDKQAKQLEREAFVAAVVKDRSIPLIHPVASVEEPPPENELWGLEAIGLAKIRAQYPKLDGSGVRVGIIDTGLQHHHPEFLDPATGSYVSVTFKDFVNGIAYPYDDQGHGTHVAGTIAGNSVGIAPKASLIVAKALAAGGYGFTSWLVDSMQWMYDPDGNPLTEDHAHLVSNSWGSNILPAIHDIYDPHFQPFHRALVTWVRAGIVPIFAAGNSGLVPNGIPGGFPEAIAVGATKHTGEIAPFSSLGPNIWQMGAVTLSVFKPDVSAPGADIKSSIPGNEFDVWSGTSMATPHVSGAVALALQANKKLGAAEMKRFLIQSAKPQVSAGFGHGSLDAHALIKAVLANR